MSRPLDLTGHEVLGEGSDFVVVRDGAAWGVKASPFLSRAEVAAIRDAQAVLARERLAPAVRPEVRRVRVMFDGRVRRAWGYWTELARQRSQFGYWAPRADVRRLLARVRRVFPGFECDDHAGNYGLIRGRLVLLDLGEIGLKSRRGRAEK